MKHLYESILDDEDILVNNADDYITATAIYNKIIGKEQLTKTDINWISNKVGVYKVNRNKLEKLLFIIGREKKYHKLSLNWLDVSQIEDMSFMFNSSRFNGNISKWDVSNVRRMDYMFYNSQFNKDISKWNVGKVENMRDMFRNSQFNKDISKWNMSNVENTIGMFDDCAIKDKYKPKNIK